MKVIYMVILAMVFLIPLASGLEFDNVKSYDIEKKEITVTNLFGFGKEIAKIKLNTPLDFKVALGYRKVAEFEINQKTDYTNVLKKLELYDKNKNEKEITRNFDYKYLTTKEVTIKDYTTICLNTAPNGTKIDCSNKISGEHKETQDAWELLEDAEFEKDKTITVGIFTDVKKGDKVEWIPNIYGARINEWAVWTEDMNVGLLFYYNMTQLTGDLIDIDGGTLNSSVGLGILRDEPGIIGKSYFFSGIGQTRVDESLQPLYNPDPLRGFTYNMWTRSNGTSAGLYGAYRLINTFKRQAGGTWGGYFWNAGGNRDTGVQVADGNWHMLTVSYNPGATGVASYDLWTNGTLVVTYTRSGTMNTGTENYITLGGYDNVEYLNNVWIDEVGFWNRTLNSSEIADLYNGGSGITYRNVFTALDLVYPENTTYSTLVTELNYTQEGLAHCWATTDGGATNSTIVTAGVNFTLSSVGGDNTWTVTCNTTADVISTDSVTFYVDAGVETFLKSPADALSTTDTTIEFEVNATAVGGARLRNQTIYIYYSNSTLLTTNYSTISGLTSSRKFNYTFVDGAYIWNAITEANSSAIFVNDWDTNRTLTVDSTAPIISITHPTTAIDFFKINNNLRINWTVSDVTAGLDTCWIEYQSLNTTVTCNNNGTLINITNSINKSAVFYANDTFGNQNSNSFNWSYKVFWNSETFNATVYESQTQSYILNISSTGDETVTANFSFNGTNYTTTKEGNNTDMNFTFSHDLPIGVGTLNFNWNVFYGSEIINTTPQSQTVDLLNLSLCGLGGLNTPFLNFTAKDEATDLPLNFTVDIADWTYYYLGEGDIFKTYSFLNVSANTSSYAFCATPNLTIQQSLEVKYSDFAGDYPLRTYKTLEPISNTTTNTVLYLLKATDGQYVTFQVLSGSGSPIQNVVANATREIPQGSGNVVLIGSGLTDASGAITYFVNPDFSHTFTFDGTSLGLPKRIETITPSKTEYTIYLSQVTAVGNTTFDFTKGMTWRVSPRLNYLQNGTFYNFNFTLNASYWAVTRYGFTLLNGSGAVLGYNDSTSLAPSQAPVLNISTAENTSIRMEYFWLVTGNYTNGTRTWGVFAEDDKGFGLNRFFTDFLAYSNAGVFGLNDFSRTLIIFLVIFLTIGAITMLSGLYSPGAILIQLFGLVYFFDVVLGLIINPVGAIPHFATIITLILAIGYAVREVTR